MICLYNQDRVVARDQEYFLDSPLQVELAARHIAWQAVLQPIDLQMQNEGRFGSLFRQALKSAHQTADLLLSEMADWGVSITQNAQTNSELPFRDGMGLKGLLKGQPAFIVGAGSSVEQFSLSRDKGWIFAAGTGAEKLSVEPHFVGAIDKLKPLKAHPNAILCTQLRAHPAAWASHKERLVFADSYAPWLNWLLGAPSFESGWTVANFLTAVATLAGCNPIVFVGLDFCYEQAPDKEGLIEVENRKGERVWTQRDWVLSAQWTEQWMARYPKVRFCNTSERSLISGFSVPDLPSQNFSFCADALPLKQMEKGRWDQWKKEAAEETLLESLWSVWRPVFEREGGDLELHKRLFFDQVVRAYERFC